MLARLGGRPVGLVANNPMFYGGAMNADAAAENHFMELCDTFHLPIVFLVDVPGFMVGPKAEERVHCVKAWTRVCRRPAPGSNYHSYHSQVLRHGGHGNQQQERRRSQAFLAKRGMGVAAVRWGRAAFRREIAAAEDPKVRERGGGLSLGPMPHRSERRAMGIEEIIDPRDTRSILCEHIALTEERLRIGLGPCRAGVAP